jgi:hypothetical protein
MDDFQGQAKDRMAPHLILHQFIRPARHQASGATEHNRDNPGAPPGKSFDPMIPANFPPPNLRHFVPGANLFLNEIPRSGLLPHRAFSLVTNTRPKGYALSILAKSWHTMH